MVVGVVIAAILLLAATVYFVSEGLLADDGSAVVVTTTSEAQPVTTPSSSTTTSTATATAITEGTEADFPVFSSAKDFTMVGLAIHNESELALRLTPSANQVSAGAAWFTQKLPVQDGFETTFSFRLSNIPQNPGDGFAFVIQNHSQFLHGEGASGIGYKGLPNSIAVEFDTTYQDYESDPNGNHIAVHTRGTAPNTAHVSAQLGSSTPLFNLWDGRPHLVTISYRPGTLSVFLDYDSKAILEVALDIGDKLNLDDGRAWVGFTAATEPGFRETHDILSWFFTAGPPEE